MRTHTNEPLVKRNAMIGKYATIGGLVILVGGVVVSVSFNNQAQTDTLFQTIPFVTLIVGFILSNVGTYFMSRFVREPRADQAFEGALKGMDDRYHLYNFYNVGAAHLLVTPAGLFAIVPKFQKGKVTWDGKAWKHPGGNFFLSLFGQENLGNPNAEAASDADRIAKFLAKKVGGDIPPVQALIVFYNPNTTIEADNPPIPTVHVKQLKDHLRRLGKPAQAGRDGASGKRSLTLTSEQIAKLDEAIGI